MEDTVISEEEDADSKNFSISIDHGHLARNYLMKIIMPAVKALVALLVESLNISSL